MNNAFSVKQINNYIKNIFSKDFILKNIYIEGEVVNLSINKYTYFSLKEDEQKLFCVYFDNDYDIKNGDKVIVNGNINIYSRDSRYQLIVKNISKNGQGIYSIELEKLKQKLSKKGYFEINRKKIIPKLPNKIGLITGFNSAAYFDFIKVLKDNNYDVDIIYYPTLVQGLKAEEDIINGLKILSQYDLDLIVLTRGGGSKEDLSIFNNESIADTIYEYKIPILTAIGHEIDLSIADLVSDMYVQTPTKAGEILINNYRNYILNLSDYNKSIRNSIENKIKLYKNYIDILNKEIIINSPHYKLENNILNLNYINKNNYNYTINKINDLKINIDNISNNINKKYNEIIKKNQVFIKDSDSYIEISNLVVNKEYFLESDKYKYKILVEEKYSE